MASLSTLDIQFTTTGADAAARSLDNVADKSVKAEAATDGLAASNRRAGGAVAQMVASIERSLSELVALQRVQRQATGAANDQAVATAGLAGQQEALVRTQRRLNAAHMDGAKSSKTLTMAGLGLSRQFADIGVTAAMGMNPLMILIQQGPQVADIFSQAKIEGLGFSAVLKGLYAQLAPLLIPLAAIGAVVAVIGSGFALSARQINEENGKLTDGLGLTADQLEKVKNKTITMGDVLTGTFNAAKGALLAAFGPQLKAAGKAIDGFLDGIAKGTVNVIKGIVGGFMGAYGAVTAVWKMLPGAFGDATISAANLALAGLEALVNGAIGLLNSLINGMNARFKLAIPVFNEATFSRLKNQYAGQMLSAGSVGAEAFAKGNAAGASLVEKGLAAITRETIKAAEARVKKEAGDAKATKETKDQADAVGKLSDKVVSFTEKQIRMSDAVKVANDNIKTMGDVLGDVRIPSSLENMIALLEQAQRQSGAVANAVDDIFYSIKGNDWAGAFSGLLRAIDGVKKGFAAGASSADKFNAVAGLAQGVGSAIGGRTGSAISGAASGAMAGFTLGGPVGAAVGGVLGGIASLFGSSKAKKQAKAEAEAQRLADAAAKALEIANQKRSLELQLMELQGNSAAALAEARKDELAGMDASNRALAEQVYAAQDAAGTLELGIQLLEARGMAEEALYNRQQQQLAGLAEADQVIQRAIWAEQDLAKAREAAADIARQVAERQGSIQDQIDQMSLSSSELTAKARAAELAEAVKLDASLVPLLETLYGLQDAATATAVATAAASEALANATAIAEQGRALEIRLMEAQGNASGVLAANRANELAATNEQNRVTLLAIYAAEDLAVANDNLTRSQQAAADAAAELLNAQRNDAAALVDRARSDLTEAYGREQSEIQATIDKHRSMAQSLREYRRALIPGATAGTAAGYALSKADFERVSTLARLGNEEALGQLQGVSEAFREESLKNAKSSLDYLSDLARINDAVRQAEETSTRQASIAEQQLASLNAQVSGLMVVNQSVLTVAQAITALQSAIGVQNSTWGGAMANPGREWGVNADANQLLARTTGYAGDFGGGGFQAWIEGQSEAVKAQARAILQAQGQAYRVAFADGGVFTSPTNFRMGSQLGQMAEAGPEAIMPLVQTSGGLGVRAVGDGDTANEIRALRSEVASLRTALEQVAINTGRGARAGEKHLDLFDRVTDGGEAMQTEAA